MLVDVKVPQLPESVSEASLSVAREPAPARRLRSTPPAAEAPVLAGAGRRAALPLDEDFRES